jgi:hypothetical protein
MTPGALDRTKLNTSMQPAISKTTSALAGAQLSAGGRQGYSGPRSREALLQCGGLCWCWCCSCWRSCLSARRVSDPPLPGGTGRCRPLCAALAGSASAAAGAAASERAAAEAREPQAVARFQTCPSPPPAADYYSATLNKYYHIPTTGNTYYYIWGALNYCDGVTTVAGKTVGATQLVSWGSNAEQKEAETSLFVTQAHDKSNRRGWASPGLRLANEQRRPGLQLRQRPRRMLHAASAALSSLLTVARRPPHLAALTSRSPSAGTGWGCTSSTVSARRGAKPPARQRAGLEPPPPQLGTCTKGNGGNGSGSSHRLGKPA